MNSSYHVSMYAKGIFLYLLLGTFYFLKDKIISRIHQQKNGEGFHTLNSSNKKGI